MLEAIRASVSDEWRRNLDALGAEFDARLAALQPSFGELDHARTITERLAEELGDAAAREAEQAATRARYEAEQVADKRLAAAEATARSQLEQARTEQDALRGTIEALQAQMQEAASSAQAEVHAIRGEQMAALAEAREAQATLSASLTAAQEDAAAARTEVQERSARLEVIQRHLQTVDEAHEGVRQNLVATEARLASEARERAALAASLEAAHQATTVARAEADASQADNDALRRANEALQAQMQEAASAAQAEVHAIRAELTAALTEAREAQATLSASLTAAQEDVKAARQEVHERAAQLEAAEQRLQALEAAHTCVQQTVAATELQLVSEARARAALAVSLEAAPLARLRWSLKAFAGLTHAPDVLETFLEEFHRSFDRVALFAVRENRLEGWRSVGFEPTTDISNLIIPLTVDSPLARAASERTSIMVEGDADNPTTGLLGHDTYCAIAIPIVIPPRLVAVAYAELARRLPAETRMIELQMAEILAEHFRQSFTRSRRPSDTSLVVSSALGVRDKNRAAAPTSRPASTMANFYPGPPRAVNRVQMPEAVEVLVDGATARLVDISSLGAQVLCATMIRPNHQVRMVLPREGQNTLCRGQVMWAQVELVPGGVRYRAGLKFTNVDADGVEAFLSQHLANNQRTSA